MDVHNRMAVIAQYQSSVLLLYAVGAIAPPQPADTRTVLGGVRCSMPLASTVGLHA